MVRICALASVVAGLMVMAEAARGQEPWPLTDGLGRAAPLVEEVGSPKAGRTVGIFYFINHDRVVPMPGGGPPDVSKILAADPDALKHPDSPLWGPEKYAHFWGEPLFGYYQSDDAWVLRRHAALLSAAGVDVLIFDTTNAATYPAAYHRLCDVFTEVRRQGGKTPQFAFMVNTEAGATAKKLYHDIYEKGLYKPLWFEWEGKPLLICDPAEASPELKTFFTLRSAHWPFTLVNTRNAWHWETTYPQVYGYTIDPSKPEEVNVSVAQNLRAADGLVTNMSEGNARGRGFHDGRNDSSADAIDSGANFAEQWKRALELQPPFVMVTGWNEWVAGRFRRGSDVIFVDQFSREFSRDIEPMRGGHADNFYCQLVENIRRYKGVAPIPVASPEQSIDIDRGAKQWDEVQPDFRDDPGDTTPRDAAGAGGMHYINRTGRNDLVSMKVARDATNVFFYGRTSEPISPSTDRGWMWLLIDVDSNARTGWEGYDFIVNRTIDPDGSSWLEKNVGGWKWEKVVRVRQRVEGNVLQLEIPRRALGINEGNKISFNFKWADNLQSPGDVMDFYLSGDVAPESRFMFRYRGE